MDLLVKSFRNEIYDATIAQLAHATFTEKTVWIFLPQYLSCRVVLELLKLKTVHLFDFGVYNQCYC